MNDVFNVNRGVESIVKVQPHTPGSIWLTEDGQNLYFDSKNDRKRIKISDVIDLSSEQPKTYFPNKLYIDGYKIKTYNETTKSLNVISDLESEILEPLVEFTFDENDNTIATFIDSSLPKKGTIVVDNAGNVGVVISSTNSMVTVKLISTIGNEKIFSGYDIYFDSNYTGKQIGTFEYPFHTWDELYSVNEKLLQSSTPVTIHLKTNSILEFKTITRLNSIIFEGNEYARVNGRGSTVALKICENITFKNLNIDFTSQNSALSSSDDITFKNCTVNNMGLSGCNNIYIDNCNIKGTVYCARSRIISARDSSIYSFDGADSDEIYLHSCALSELTFMGNTVDVMDKCDIKIIDCEINTNIYIINADSVILNGGNFYGGKCFFDAENLNLGTFNLNNADVTLTNNTISQISGLSSKQVYDIDTNRTYGKPYNNTLSAHLDKISEYIDSLNGNGNNTMPPDAISSPTNAFVSKGVFYNKDDLNKSFKIGDIMTYVNDSYLNLQFDYELTGVSYESKSEYNNSLYNYLGTVDLFSNLPANANVDDVYTVKYDAEYIPLNARYRFNGTGWELVNKEEYRYYKFSLENADYYIKISDTVNLLNYSNIANVYQNVNFDTQYITAKIQSISYNELLVKINHVQLLSQIKDSIIFNDGTTNDEALENIALDIIDKYLSDTLTQSTFTHYLSLQYKDRLVRLSNGWDKLCNSNSNDSSVSNSSNSSVEKLEYYGDSKIKISNSNLFTFTPNSSTTATVSKNIDNSGFNVEEFLVIPYKCTIDNQEFIINRIDSNAFEDCDNLVSVHIPTTINIIGENAFAECNNITLICRKGSIADTYAKNNYIDVSYDKLSSSDSISDKMVSGTYVGTGLSDEKTFIFDSKPKFMYIYQINHSENNVTLASATYIGGSGIIMINNGSDAVGTHNRYLGNVIELDNVITFTNALDLNRAYTYAWIAILN